MNNIHQNFSDSKLFSTFSSVLSKDCLNISRLLSQSGFRKHSGVGVLVLFMALIESVLSGAKSLHDRYSLNYVASTECSYHALMRFVSKSKHNCSLLMLLKAKAAISRCWELNWDPTNYQSEILNHIFAKRGVFAKYKRLGSLLKFIECKILFLIIRK